MSDHYLFHLTFAVREDAPAQLKSALAKRSAGKMPTAEEVSDLPPIVQSYLRSGGAPGDGIYCFHPCGPRSKFSNGQMVEIGWEPHEGSHLLRMAHTFHDDEYWNGGMFYVFWLYQFVAYDGPIGTMQQTNGNDPAAILTKVDNHIVETATTFDHSNRDKDKPISIDRTQSFDLSQMLDQLADFADGHATD